MNHKTHNIRFLFLIGLILWPFSLFAIDTPEDKTILTESYRVTEKTFTKNSDVKKVLEEMGIDFKTEGSGAVYDGSSILIVKNTRENLDLLNSLFGHQGNFIVGTQVDYVSVKRTDLSSIFDGEIGGMMMGRLSPENLDKLEKVIRAKKAFVLATLSMNTISGRETRTCASEAYSYVRKYIKDKDGIVQSELDTRQLGPMVKSVIHVGADLSTIEFTVVAEYTFLKSIHKMPVLNGQKEISLESPRFAVRRIETQAFARSGDTILLGVTDGVGRDKKDDPDSVLLFLMKTQLNQL